jgi:opacity protein-like surface antigen
MVTNNITARIEYRYTDYQKKDFNVGGAPHLARLRRDTASRSVSA